MSTPLNDALTRQAGGGVRGAPWRTLLLSAAGASTLGLLGAAGLAPLLASVGIGTLSQGAFAQWLAAFGGSVIANWTGDLVLWAAARGLNSTEDAAQPVVQQGLAEAIDTLLAQDAAAAGELARLLQHIDALPQSLAALEEEVGAQSELLLAQTELLTGLSRDLQRLGVVAGALQPALDQQSERILAALEAQATRSDASFDRVISALQAMRASLALGAEVRAEGDRATAVTAGAYAQVNVDNSQHITILPTPRSEPPGAGVFQVPYPPNPLFRGRDAELQELAHTLLAQQGGTAAVLPAIAGTGGIGKTQLASEFAHRHRDDFPGGVFWLNMEQPEGVAAQVAAAGGPGGLELPGWAAMEYEGKIAAVRQAWQGPERRLLVFDNLEEPKLLQEWRPTGGGTRVLITTRRGVWTATSGVQAVRLQTLARPESVRLLLAPRHGAEVEAVLATEATAREADAICEQVGDLPLALALAGAYLEAAPSLSLAGYRARLAEQLLAHPSLQAELAEGLPTRHAESVAATIALSYQRLNASADSRAGTLLHRTAHLAPAPLPHRLLAHLAECDPDDDDQVVELDGLLRRLAAVGLIELLPEGDAVLHRLIAAFLRDQDAERETTWAATADALGAAVSAINRAGYPLQGTPYLVHLQYLLVAEGQGISEQVAYLCNELGYLLRAQGDLAGARPLYERALAITEQALGASHPGTARSLNNLGTLLDSMGDLAGARRLLERALAITEQALGASHPDTARSLNNLGTLLQAQGDLAGARPLYERALAIREQALGSSHPDTARILNNLGLLLQAQGDVAGARPYFERALAITEQALGSTHPDTASSLNNLAYLHQSQGEYGAARPLYERALALRERVLGPDHPDTGLR